MVMWHTFISLNNKGASDLGNAINSVTVKTKCTAFRVGL